MLNNMYFGRKLSVEVYLKHMVLVGLSCLVPRQEGFYNQVDDLDRIPSRLL